MTVRRALTIAALSLAAASVAAHAQTSTENRDADALAADMRLLAANSNDVEALIKAGELTLKMGDTTAAAGFFGRAEKLDPNNPRIKAGWGALLVRAERPGEALRRFQDAEARGLDPALFAGDRGLAYDLIGQQERAQRDYRLVLRAGADDEVTRRYALSLGISGRKDEALALLDPLLQRSDRAAWRSRAFVLAMAGDATGADRIATTMMAPGMGAALAPFFRRLPELPPADRAFAVTFGELRAGPERIADARMAPSLPPLGPDPYAPRPVVAAAAPVVVADNRSERRKKRRRKDELTAVAATPVPTPASPTLAPPGYAGPVAPTYAPPAIYRPPVTLAQVAPSRGPSLPVVTPPSRSSLPVVTPPSRSPLPVVTPPSRNALPVITPPARTPPPQVATTEPATGAAVSLPIVTLPARTASPIATTTIVPASPPVAATPPVVVAAAPAAVAEPPQPGVADQPSPAEAGAPQPNAIARVSEDSVLARIVADAGAVPSTASAAPKRPAGRVSTAKPARDVGPRAADPGRERAEVAFGAKPAAIATVRGKPDATPTADGKNSRGKGESGTTTEAVVALDKNGCPLPPAKGKSARTKPTLAVRGVKPASAAKCKALAAKDKADADGKGEPARVWVQVAGGANEASLQTAWGIMRDRAPQLLRGRQGWTTPLRATNRVLTGPFKDEDEAQAFVNKLTKAGVPAFVFTSAKGQKVEKLSGK